MNNIKIVVFKCHKRIYCNTIPVSIIKYLKFASTARKIKDELIGFWNQFVSFFLIFVKAIQLWFNWKCIWFLQTLNWEQFVAAVLYRTVAVVRTIKNLICFTCYRQKLKWHLCSTGNVLSSQIFILYINDGVCVFFWLS